MLDSIKYINNVGRFAEIVDPDVEFGKLNLAYADNGRGKSTLVAILRSMGTGDASHILERRRLGAKKPPKVVVEGITQYVFHASEWNSTLPGIRVFDDHFVDENVHSGLGVVPEQRRNLHTWIIGARAVGLNRQLQALIEKVDEHSSNLREISHRIPSSALDGLDIEQFCDLAPLKDLEAELGNVRRSLETVSKAEDIARTSDFKPVTLPSIPTDKIGEVLLASLDSIEEQAIGQVRAHFRSLGSRGERWIAERVVAAGDGEVQAMDKCPFCGQSLDGLDLIAHYRSYFGGEYRSLLSRIESIQEKHLATTSATAIGKFERGIASISEGVQFWRTFVDLPALALDSENCSLCWESLRTELTKALGRKRDRPLESQSLTQEVQELIVEMAGHLADIEEVNGRIKEANELVARARLEAATEDRDILARKLAGLTRVKRRFEPEVAAVCDDYIRELQRKKETEQERDTVRKAFEKERKQAFEDFPAALNRYLADFNADFRVEGLHYKNPRGGPSSEYHLAVSGHAVQLGGERGSSGESGAAFRSTLSSGDRRSLALAVFLAGIEREVDPKQLTIVIDDPTASLDAHRSTATAQAIISLANRVEQTFVLSHSKEFLGLVYRVRRGLLVSQCELVSEGEASVIEPWDVASALAAAHEVRHKRFREFVEGKRDELMAIAWSIRPHLEYFLSIVHPDDFESGIMLGKFIGKCHARIEDGNPVMTGQRLNSLASLNEYTRPFHHKEQNVVPTGALSEDELRGFVRKTLEFTRL